MNAIEAIKDPKYESVNKVVNNTSLSLIQLTKHLNDENKVNNFDFKTVIYNDYSHLDEESVGLVN